MVDQTAVTERVDRHPAAAVRMWLFVLAALVFLMVAVGGATRLTDSGLSITEWKPVVGIVPPLNEADWQDAFAKYRQTPEYLTVNRGMSLEAFKVIFWWEWGHRFLGRLIGMAFVVPFSWFLWRGQIPRGLAPKLTVVFALGALQGAIGWYMVQSGLVARVDVSQYRLAIHLTLACLIFVAIMIVARGLAPHSESAADRKTQRFAGVLVLLVLAQIFLGGLVAGLDAGMSYNDWPTMDGALIPGDLFVIDPAWRNLFENPKTVQFVHRIGAYLIFVAALWLMIATRRRQPGTTHARRALVLFHLVLAQAAIGVATLVMQAPVHWALAHQGFALVVLGFAAAHWRGTKGEYPMTTGIVVND